MSQYGNNFNNNFAAPTDLFAAAASADVRAGFIMKTYAHLVLAIVALIGIEIVAFQIFEPMDIAKAMMGSPISWLVVLGMFMVVGFIADKWASSDSSKTMQYLGLGLYIVAEAVILMPLLSVVYLIMPPDQAQQTILTAAVGTGGLFALMTLAVFITRANFSFLRSFLWFGSLALFGLIIVAMFGGFEPGPIIIYVGIALACGYILYYTSNVLHEYRPDQYVAASLALFAAVMLLFWYVLRLLIYLYQQADG